MFNHILLEVYCTKDYDENKGEPTPSYCDSTNYTPHYSCLLNKCPFVTFTSHENALCYINDMSEAKKIISLPSDKKEDIVLWEKVSCEKIDEAYDNYTSKKSDA